MKIGNPADKTPPPAVNGNAAAPVQPQSQARTSAARSRTVAAPAADASATVALSNTASTLLATPASAEFDTAKVERVSHAIEHGQFKPDAGKIADKLIANAQELLGPFKA